MERRTKQLLPVAHVSIVVLRRSTRRQNDARDRMHLNKSRTSDMWICAVDMSLCERELQSTWLHFTSKKCLTVVVYNICTLMTIMVHANINSTQLLWFCINSALINSCLLESLALCAELLAPVLSLLTGFACIYQTCLIKSHFFETNTHCEAVFVILCKVRRYNRDYSLYISTHIVYNMTVCGSLASSPNIYDERAHAKYIISIRVEFSNMYIEKHSTNQAYAAWVRYYTI